MTNREHETLTTGAGLLDRSARHDLLEVTGEDRQRFLNGQVTCDLQPLEAGSSTYGFFTTRQGKIQADATLLALDDRIWLELPAGTGAEIRQRLELYALADRVAASSLPGRALLSLAGPRAAAVLEASGIEPPEPGRHRSAAFAGLDLRVDHRSPAGVSLITLWAQPEAVGELSAQLVRAGAAPVGWDAWDALRIERGVPRFGVDFGPDNLPQETGLDEAVSFTKGCYLGQEVVARIHYRGGVNKILRGLLFEGEAEAGAELVYEGRAAGTSGTVARCPGLGGRLAGLAILHRRAAEPGTRLEVAGGGPAEVRELPLVGTVG
jgi:tRNA-modifying protein YgfZ